MSYSEHPIELSGWNPGGDLGTWRTVLVLRRLARRSGEDDPLIFDAAERIVRNAATEPERVNAIRDWLEAVWRFEEDPPGVELVRTPRRLLRDAPDAGSISGDCDDAAVLAAALGIASGFPTRFQVIGFDRGGPFQHIFTELWDGQSWVALDPTRPDQPWVSRLSVERRWTFHV